MKTIEVVAAIIHRDGEYFATQRGYGNYKGMWEFPGGKIEMGESPEQALHREILEELGIHINIDSLLCTTHYDYPEFHLTMHSYICSIASGTITLHEHMDAQWLTKDNISSLNWLPADVEVINRIQSID